MVGGLKIRQDFMAANQAQAHTSLDIRLDTHLVYPMVSLLGALLKLAVFHTLHRHRHHLQAIRPLSTVQKANIGLNLKLNL